MAVIVYGFQFQQILTQLQTLQLGFRIAGKQKEQQEHAGETAAAALSTGMDPMTAIRALYKAGRIYFKRKQSKRVKL